MMFRHTNVLLAVLAAAAAIPSVVHATDPVVPDPAEPAVSEPEATPNSGECNLSNDATLNNCLQYGTGSIPYTCNRDGSFPSGNSYACCPNDQGLPDNVILDDPSTGQLNACLVTPSSDIVNPTDDPTPGPTPDPTPGPTPEPTNDPTPGPTPDPTPGPTDDPTPGPTPNPTPGPTDDPTPNPTPGPTDPPQDYSDENLVDAPREASGTGTSPTAIAATATLAAAAAAALL